MPTSDDNEVAIPALERALDDVGQGVADLDISIDGLTAPASEAYDDTVQFGARTVIEQSLPLLGLDAAAAPAERAVDDPEHDAESCPATVGQRGH